MYLSTLTFEAGVVAAATAFSLLLALRLYGPITTATDAVFVGVVMGALIHLAFELLGGNRYYCSFGAACLRSS